jgi:hypothetical protein
MKHQINSIQLQIDQVDLKMKKLKAHKEYLLKILEINTTSTHEEKEE